jgi:hypothetical protein
VKIGHSSSVIKRIQNLQTTSAVELIPIAIILTDDSKATEAEFHRRLGSHRVRGEWFVLHPDVLAVASSAESDVGIMSELQRIVRDRRTSRWERWEPCACPISVRPTGAQRDAIVAAAGAAGLSVSAWMLEAALEHFGRPAWRPVADRLADALVGASDAADLALTEYRALAAGTEPPAT